MLAAIDACVASLKESEADLVEKMRLVQGSLAEENGVPRARSKKPTGADRDVVAAKCKEIDGRLNHLKSKVEAYGCGFPADVSLVSNCLVESNAVHISPNFCALQIFSSSYSSNMGDA